MFTLLKNVSPNFNWKYYIPTIYVIYTVNPIFRNEINEHWLWPNNKKKDSKMFLFKNMFVFIMQYYCTFTLEGFLILRGTFCLLIEFLEKGNYMYLQKFTDIFVQHLRRVTIQRLWGAKDPLHYFDQFLLLILSDAFFILKVRQKEASLVLNLGQKLITLRIDFAPFSIYLLLN